MKIIRADVSEVEVPLKAPFTISYHTTYEAKMLLVQLICQESYIGLGTAVPFERVTHESYDACADALRNELPGWIEGREFEHPSEIGGAAKEVFGGLPAARAAIDMAAHDIWGKKLNKPLVELLGRKHEAMPTSMTMGIRTMDESLAEAGDFIGMGFSVLKIKGGSDLEHDIELLSRIRQDYGPGIGLRVDLNQGYDKDMLIAFIKRTSELDIEMIEQPFPVDDIDTQRGLPESIRKVLAADENACDEDDARDLAKVPQPAGIINIKMMKCGGICPAMRIAEIADSAHQTLMWGCMVESTIGLSAALHAAFASPNTRYLDLDGSYDLVEDIATGGIDIEGGVVRTVDAPGLGVTLRD